jgi:hypothetical protein
MCRYLREADGRYCTLYRFLDAGNSEACRTLGEPASKKRRCTKSRDAGQRLGGERYGDFSLASHPNGLVEAQACGDAQGMPGCGRGKGAGEASPAALEGYRRAAGH